MSNSPEDCFLTHRHQHQPQQSQQQPPPPPPPSVGQMNIVSWAGEGGKGGAGGELMTVWLRSKLLAGGDVDTVGEEAQQG